MDTKTSRRRIWQWFRWVGAAFGFVSVSFYLTLLAGERYEYVSAFFLFSGAIGFLVIWGAGQAAVLGCPRKWGALAGLLVFLFMFALASLLGFIRDNSVYQP